MNGANLSPGVEAGQWLVQTMTNRARMAYMGRGGLKVSSGLPDLGE